VLRTLFIEPCTWCQKRTYSTRTVTGDPDSEEAKKLLAAIDDARPGVDEARANFTRVQLLFGPTFSDEI
jgi:hypothetical protein